ncbi:HNH endonuclease [Streptomyces sp. NPDC056831]|uniref:HNH endonuclease n=1 Tax=Streptomyces sp. NPDC056831 TaxID=3345954 RepID=UPI0036BD4084
MAKRADLTNHGYRKARARFLADNDICHICGHPAANVIDHINPVARGADPRDEDNWAPAHGVTRCPTCGRNCNGEKGANTHVTSLNTSRDWYRSS